MICPFYGIETGMRLRLDGKDTVDDDIGSEEVVELVLELIAIAQGHAFRQVEVGVIARAVHASVGAPATRDGYSAAVEE